MEVDTGWIGAGVGFSSSHPVIVLDSAKVSADLMSGMFKSSK